MGEPVHGIEGRHAQWTAKDGNGKQEAAMHSKDSEVTGSTDKAKDSRDNGSDQSTEQIAVGMVNNDRRDKWG